MITVNQNETIFLHINFSDQNGLDVVPLSLEYVVSDYLSGEELVRSSLTPAAPAVIIPLDVVATSITEDTNEFETKIVDWYYSYTTTIESIETTAYGAGEYKYRVKNLYADKT